MYLKVGRFGPYVQRGTPDDEEKPQNASLLKGMDPADIDLATALKLLTLPRNSGRSSDEWRAVMAFNGRFGPYIKCGEETRSLPADISPLDVTLEQALHLLAQPKAARPRPRGRQARAAQSVRRVARHQSKSATARRPLRPVRDRRRNERVAPQRHADRRADVPTKRSTCWPPAPRWARRRRKSPKKKAAKAAKAATKKSATKRRTAKSASKSSQSDKAPF